MVPKKHGTLPFCWSIFGCRSSTFIESPEPRRLKWRKRVTRKAQLRIDIFARWDSLFSGNEIILLRLSRTQTTFSMDGFKEHLYTGNCDLKLRPNSGFQQIAASTASSIFTFWENVGLDQEWHWVWVVNQPSFQFSCTACTIIQQIRILYFLSRTGAYSQMQS